MSPDTLHNVPAYTAEALAQLDDLEQTAVDMCDITDVPEPVLRVLGADIVMTRVDLINAFLAADPGKRRHATVMLIETFRGKA